MHDLYSLQVSIHVSWQAKDKGIFDTFLVFLLARKQILFVYTVINEIFRFKMNNFNYIFAYDNFTIYLHMIIFINHSLITGMYQCIHSIKAEIFNELLMIFINVTIFGLQYMNNELDKMSKSQ